MKEQSTSILKREIEVLEIIIGQLKQCLGIYYKEKNFKDFRSTVNDLRKCRKELTKLKNTLDIKQGETGIDADNEQYRKNVL
jgi:hypothetical protein